MKSAPQQRFPRPITNALPQQRPSPTYLPLSSCCKNSETATLTTFRINTCKSVSKQRTLTPSRINTYKKQGRGGPPVCNSGKAPHMRHVAPLSPVASLDCAYFPSPRGCTTLCASDFSASAANPIGSSFLFILLQTAIPPTPFVSHPYKTPGVGAVLRRFAFPFARHPALATRIGSGALQDGAQLADVLKTFDGQDFLDQSCGGGSTKNGPDQVAGFGDYFVAGHGIFRRAAYVLHPLAQLRTVGERHLDDGFAARAARVDAGIGDDLHLGAVAQDAGIFHARFVVDRTEGGGFVEEHYGHHVLHADVRHIAVADGIGFIAGDAHDHFGDILGSKGALVEETGKRVERSLNGRAHRPFLDVRARDFLALAELVHENRGIGLEDAAFARREGLEEIVGAGKNVVDSGPAGADQHGSGDGSRRGLAAEQERFLHVFGIAAP